MKRRKIKYAAAAGISLFLFSLGLLVWANGDIWAPYQLLISLGIGATTGTIVHSATEHERCCL